MWKIRKNVKYSARHFVETPKKKKNVIWGRLKKTKSKKEPVEIV